MQAPCGPVSLTHVAKARTGELSGEQGCGVHMDAFSLSNQMSSVPDSATRKGITALQDT